MPSALPSAAPSPSAPPASTAKPALRAPASCAPAQPKVAQLPRVTPLPQGTTTAPASYAPTPIEPNGPSLDPAEIDALVNAPLSRPHQDSDTRVTIDLEQPAAKPKAFLKRASLALGTGAVVLSGAWYWSANNPDATDAIESVDAQSTALDTPASQPAATQQTTERRSAPTPTSTASPAASSAPKQAAATTLTTGLTACSRSAKPTELSAKTWPNVHPNILLEPDSGALGVAFASTALDAVGLKVSPETLEAEAIFEERRPQYVTSVVPFVRAGSLSFATARFLSPLSQSTLVDGPSPFTLGLTPDGVGVVYTKGGGALHWPLKRSKSTSIVRVASSERGHSMVLRVIGRPSAIRYGRLHPDGGKSSPLFTLSQGSVADPAVTMRGDEAAFAFATRMQGEPWSLVVSLATGANPPDKPSSFEVPRGGPGGGARLPSITPYGEAHYVLQWIEGLPKGVARAQLMDAELEPVGEALNISPPNQVVQSAELSTHGRHIFSVYTEGAGSNRALWATSFHCP